MLYFGYPFEVDFRHLANGCLSGVVFPTKDGSGVGSTAAIQGPVECVGSRGAVGASSGGVGALGSAEAGLGGALMVAG